MTTLATAATSSNTDAVEARYDFPGGSARTFVYVFFALLFLPMLYKFSTIALSSDGARASRRVGLLIFGFFLGMIAIGFLLTLLLITRRPTALEIRPSALVFFYGKRTRAVPWSTVIGLSQIALRRVPTHIVVFANGSTFAFGMGENAQAIARHIARRAELTWTNEPFFAQRSSDVKAIEGRSKSV